MVSVRTCCWKMVFLLALFIANYDELVSAQCKSRECPVDSKEEWTYYGDNGPSHWGKKFPKCNGNQQSPINLDLAINEKEIVNQNPLKPVNYEQPVTKATIENNGHTIHVFPEDGVERAICMDNVTYTLQNFCFHWGSQEGRGAEHIIHDRTYDMEIHFTHVNTNEKSQNRTVVVAVFVLYQEASDDNIELNTLSEEFEKVMYKDEKTLLTSSFKLDGLLPPRRRTPHQYYRYNGSSTTPPCSEGVTYLLLENPIYIGKDSMGRFRSLYSATEKQAAEPKNKCCKLSDNYRPIQPLNNRPIEHYLFTRKRNVARETTDK